ncbi:hypothetical protein KQ940_11180 [Marinobacterium sp. D7]|uniref:hypothetical protein n=1 Tax=Marinobacterium ramblicola TaxID=2849041 RepID=UPI001C2DE053|nr:hypothetical protein [Marinobacterium ramblicola]MBV1788616.1 hypothetical protein [Marinobacterium ramblicola]
MSMSIDRLKGAVEAMDGLSRENFSNIETLANLAMLRLEQGAATQDLWNDIQNTLTMIRGIAQDTMNSINCEAEDVGCTPLSKGWLFAAWYTPEKSGVATKARETQQ